MNIESLLPNPFVDNGQRLEDARADLLAASAQLAQRRNRRTIGVYYSRLDAVWAAQGFKNP
jgi:hypothetical protein